MVMTDAEKFKTAIKGAVAVGVANLFTEFDLLPFDSPLRRELASKEVDLVRVITEETLRALKLSFEIEVSGISLEAALEAANCIAVELAMGKLPPARI
jgi:hypothetical protein